MNREVLETNWVQVREILKDKFNHLSDEDIKQINGRYDQLIAKLQQKYGYSKEEAEERILNWNFPSNSSSTSPTDTFRENRAQREDKISKEEAFRREERLRREENNSILFKWFLGISIPLLLLATYFLRSPETTKTLEVTKTPSMVQEQLTGETAGDRALTNSLMSTFRSQPGLVSELQSIQITSHNGIVTISGTVSNQEASDLMTTTAQKTPEVREVINNLQIK